MKVTVVSLNGFRELSGGGLYLRSLVRGLLDTGVVDGVTVVSKKTRGVDLVFGHEVVQEIELGKNAFKDVLARVCLQPTFLGVYQRAILAACEKADLVVFHNSRCGLLFQALKRHFPAKPVLIASDNVEVDLLRQHRFGKKGLAALLHRLEEFEIRRAEAYCRQADFMTFITRNDRALFEAYYGGPALSEILPITVERAADVVEKASPVPAYVLFTGHFAFQPNVDSLKVLLDVARRVNEGRGTATRIEFIVAGAALDKLELPIVQGVSYHSSPSVAQMDTLFRQAACYLAPVLWGSGMKTKVAEALSYGLPVVALPNAGVGYEDLLADTNCAQALSVVQDIPNMVASLKELIDGARLLHTRGLAIRAYEKWYSGSAQARRFTDIFCRLGLV